MSFQVAQEELKWDSLLDGRRKKLVAKVREGQKKNVVRAGLSGRLFVAAGGTSVKQRAIVGSALMSERRHPLVEKRRSYEKEKQYRKVLENFHHVSAPGNGRSDSVGGKGFVRQPLTGCSRVLYFISMGGGRLI